MVARKPKLKVGDKVKHKVDGRKGIIIKLTMERVYPPYGKKVPIADMNKETWNGMYSVRHLSYLKEYTSSTFLEEEIELDK